MGHKQTLRARYHHLRPNTINDPAKEQEWNELARLFVQRFQEIHKLPPDSLAGMQTFQVLEKLAKPTE